MVGRGRGRGRKRKGPGRVITVPNNKPTIPDDSTEKQEILPMRGRDGHHILVQIPRTKHINKILNSTLSNKSRKSLNYPQDHPLTVTIPEVGYNFRPRVSKRVSGKPPSQPKKDITNSNLADSADSNATKTITVDRTPKKSPSVKSTFSNRSHLSEMIPFSYVNVPDKRYDDYIPLSMMALQNGCEGSIDSSDDGSTGYTSDDQRIETGVELAKSPLRIASDSAASSPLGSSLDEYEFTVEEEDELLQGSEVDAFSDTKTSSVKSGQQIVHQKPNFSTFKEPNVEEVFKAKDIIVRSDNNITIRAFSSDIFKQNVDKPDIIPKYCIPSQPKIQPKPIKKKFKGDYHPDVSVKLFSHDTGYESDSSIDSDNCDKSLPLPIKQLNLSSKIKPICSTANSVDSSKWTNSNSITNFKVTCTDHHRVFESVSIVPEEIKFKVPTLPPVKRPPSRPKKSNTSSLSRSCSSSTGSSDSDFMVVDSRTVNHGGSEHLSGSSNETRLNPSMSWAASQRRMVTGSKDQQLRISIPAKSPHVVPDDDSISIIASSLGGDHDVGNLKDLRGMNDTEIKTEIDEDFREQSLLGEKRPFIENWVNDVNSAVPTEWDGPTPPSDWNDPQNINVRPEPGQTNTQNNGKVVSTNDQINNNKVRVQFKDVPHVLHGVCYFKYINGACFKQDCVRDHEVKKDKYMRKLENATSNQVMEAYQFLKKLAQSGNYTFYKDIHHCFLLAFGHHQLQNELISSIQDLFMLQHCLDVAEGIDFVVRGLERCGLTFLDAVEKITYNVGFMQYPLLADYLLQLMSRKSQLKSNWDVMKRLIKARGHISPELASTILLKATNMYPPDKTFCKDVYAVIVEQNMTEVSQLESKYLIPIRMLVTTSMSKEAILPSYEPGNSKVIIPSPPETLKQHINANLNRQREIFERSHSPEITFPDKPSIFNSPPAVASKPSFNSPVRMNLHSLSSKSTSTCSNNSGGSYNEHGSSSLSHYVPKIMPRQRVADLVSLFPVHPIVGKANYRTDYEMDVSLHNLLPDSDYHTDINEADVTKLNEAILFTDADVFLILLEHYKSKQTMKKFITMAVAHLRSCCTVYKTFMDLVNAIAEITPDFATTPYMKGMIEVIVFNLLHTLKKKGYWKYAASLVAKFCDWDSLVSSQMFPFPITHMGRYIYLANILVTGENYLLAYEILQCPTLYLLESPDKWPYPSHPEYDLQFRNEVLTNFFKGYQQNFLVVLDMYRKIFTCSGVFGFDVTTAFNSMMIDLINQTRIAQLNHMLEDIQIFAKQMDNHILRAYTAVISRHLPLALSMRLYGICCERRIYPSFQGIETVITIYNNILDEEIYLILLAYLLKLIPNKLPSTDVTIKISIPDAYPPHPDIIKLVRCVKDINIVIRNILKDKFNVVVMDKQSQCSAWIVITLDQIKACMTNLR